MNDQSFTTSFTVDQSPKEVFAAVNNVRGWWSEQIDGATDQLNSEFRYHYKDLHQCRIKITEMIPGKKVSWKVLENYFSFTKDKTGQWKNTEIVFEITEKDGKTELKFTHVGLTPDEECYNVCFDAWTGYINKSLKSLITTGTGNPTKDDHSKFNDDIQKKWNG
ncbi:MAG: ATPase [Citrobacter freundii]|nr:MAG: ATPase [Citrobacter freundii]